MKYKNFIRNFLVTSLALISLGCSGVNSRLEKLALHAKGYENYDAGIDKSKESGEIASIIYTNSNLNGKIDPKDKIEFFYGGNLSKDLVPSFIQYLCDIGLDKIPEEIVINNGKKILLINDLSAAERDAFYEEILYKIETLKK